MYNIPTPCETMRANPVYIAEKHLPVPRPQQDHSSTATAILQLIK